MCESAKIIFGIILPFFGTSFGALTVFVLKKDADKITQKALVGIASGVMLAASVWSLLIPAIDLSENNSFAKWFPAVTGFLVGVLFLILIDDILKKMQSARWSRHTGKKSFLMFLAVTLHNIPEGMAVGVVLSALLEAHTLVSEAEVFALVLGITVQNFPEGAMISLPLAGEGVSKQKALFVGLISGIVEPISAIITIAITSVVGFALPYVLSFAAGAMVYVVISDLIPDINSDQNDHVASLSVAIGFSVMMLLDVALG